MPASRTTLESCKCQIKKSDVKVYGNLLTTTGMQPYPNKVDDIGKLVSPYKQTRTTLISWHGYIPESFYSEYNLTPRTIAQITDD